MYTPAPGARFSLYCYTSVCTSAAPLRLLYTGVYRFRFIFKYIPEHWQIPPPRSAPPSRRLHVGPLVRLSIARIPVHRLYDFFVFFLILLGADGQFEPYVEHTIT